MFLSIIVRFLGFLTSGIMLISSIVKIIKNRHNRSLMIKPVILLIVAVSIPYIMLFYGKYRTNRLDLKNNVEDVISSINELDIEKFDFIEHLRSYYDNHYVYYYDEDEDCPTFDEYYRDFIKDADPVYPGYECVELYEAEIPYIYLKVAIYESEKRMDKKTFMSTCLDAVGGVDVNEDIFRAKTESGEKNGIYWAASPLIAYDEPTLKTHSGVYDGYFAISEDNKIYLCTYCVSVKAPIPLIAFMNIKPKYMTAVELINMFIGVENGYGIEEEIFD